jgi:hypothetical protein
MSHDTSMTLAFGGLLMVYALGLALMIYVGTRDE